MHILSSQQFILRTYDITIKCNINVDSHDKDISELESGGILYAKFEYLCKHGRDAMLEIQQWDVGLSFESSKEKLCLDIANYYGFK